MRPRVRAVVVLAILGLVFAGLLLAGPAHLALHKPGDAHPCEACLLHAAAPAIVVLLPQPLTGAVLTPRPARLRLPDSPVHLLPPSRGPPALG